MENENENETKQLVLNRIQTPDGTILTSRHRHDYVSHEDKNGHTYMTDGGLSYERRALVEGEQYKDLSVYLDDDFVVVREAFAWGTFGKNGDQPLSHVNLCDMTDAHIQACLDTNQGAAWVKDLWSIELEYRHENDITITD